jgi:hypothetical protein
MPSASLATIQAWPHGEGEAHNLLAANFGETQGYFYPLVEGYEANEQEAAAIQYLIEEWDYGYLSGPAQAESFHRELNEMYELLNEQRERDGAD